MPTDTVLDNFITSFMKDEFIAVNSHLPRSRKSIAQLIEEDFPHVSCSDGTSHSFRRKEIEYLASILEKHEQAELLLPIMLEVSRDHTIRIDSPEGIEKKVLEQILGMNITLMNDKIVLYRPQLIMTRKVLRTSTQYVFTLSDA